jgi:hypothetical protein
MKKSCLRLYVVSALAGAVLLGAAPAQAQFHPRPMTDPATGETFHIEFGASVWTPSSDIVVSSAGSGALTGLAGTDVDAKRDLGFTDQRLPNLKLILRPAAAHKFRLDFVPISFTGNSTITQDIVFNGQRYRIGLPLTSTLDWKAYRFGYEYDFIRQPRYFGGFILEAKYTDVRVELDTIGLQEFARARAPIPAIGGIGRVYVVPNISITGDVTGFKLPTVEGRYAGHYVDVDIYGTVNFTNNIGVQGGYRSLDMGYLVKQDTGSFVLRGVYFGVVARY